MSDNHRQRTYGRIYRTRIRQSWRSHGRLDNHSYEARYIQRIGSDRRRYRRYSSSSPTPPRIRTSKCCCQVWRELLKTSSLLTTVHCTRSVHISTSMVQSRLSKSPQSNSTYRHRTQGLPRPSQRSLLTSCSCCYPPLYSHRIVGCTAQDTFGNRCRPTPRRKCTHC
jgi:hypothetical protein